MQKIFPLSAVVLLAACATLPAEAASDGTTMARFGQTVRVGGPRVTPLRLLSDSRCPMEARCVWAGQVRISARIDLGRRSELREITLNQPEQVADGTLELVEVMPPSSLQHPLTLRDYRFGFRFAGGI